MANYSVWNVRMRHEWLATPLKKKRIKRRAAQRLGLLDAWERQGRGSAEAAAPEGDAEAATTEEAAAEATS